ncbi:MAG: acyltransferase family protein [Terricaulis sp.]
MTLRPGLTPSASATSARALDIGRGMAMLLVIYGHALAPWFMEAHGRFSEAAFLQWKFGASFLMPFFFVVSGLTWRAEKSLRAMLRESLVLIITAWAASVAIDVVRLMLTWGDLSALLGQEPLSVWRFLRHALRMAVLGDFYSMSALWFLAALGLVRLFAAVGTRLGGAVPIVLILVLIAAGLTAQAMGWRSIHQIYLLGMALACFLGGHAARNAFERLLGRPGLAFAIMVICGAAVSLTFGLNQGCLIDATKVCGIPSLEGNFGVSMMHGGYGNLPLFMFTALAGISFALAAIVLIAQASGPVVEFLRLTGRRTINVLIVNAAVLEFANPSLSRWVVPQIAADAPHFFAALFVISVAFTMLGVFIFKTPLKALRSFARALAHYLVALWPDSRTIPILALPPDRVSAGHER